jgi:hypothetical protein
MESLRLCRGDVKMVTSAQLKLASNQQEARKATFAMVSVVFFVAT